MKNLLYPSFMLLLFTSCKQEETRQTKQYTIEQFYANTRFSGGHFSPDETKLLINSDESGIFNVYEINIADGTKKPITHSTDESYFAVDYVPGFPGLIYTGDKGGNEIDHLFLLEDNGTITDLTPGEQEKANFFKWTQDKKALFYSSNVRDPKYFDIYKSTRGEWKPTLFYENKDGLDVSAISDDEKTLAITKPVTTSENELYLVNRETGERKEISQPDQKGNYDIAGFSKDNRFAFYITNAGKEFSYLAQYDMQSGERKVLFETNWDVMYSYLSENEKYRVMGINEDGKNSIIVQDAATGKAIDFPSIPDGDILGLDI
jgi:Tol biopolymer transport system component